MSRCRKRYYRSDHHSPLLFRPVEQRMAGPKGPLFRLSDKIPSAAL